MHLFKCTNTFDLVINVLKNKCICLNAQIHMSLNRIIYICHSTVSYRSLKEYTANNTFPIDLVIGPSRDRFATDSFEMGDRRDVVKILETCGLQQIKPPTAKVQISYYKMSAG